MPAFVLQVLSGDATPKQVFRDRLGQLWPSVRSASSQRRTRTINTVLHNIIIWMDIFYISVIDKQNELDKMVCSIYCSNMHLFNYCEYTHTILIYFSFFLLLSHEKKESKTKINSLNQVFLYPCYCYMKIRFYIFAAILWLEIF